MSASVDARSQLLALERDIDAKVESLPLLTQPRQGILTLAYLKLWELRHGVFRSSGPSTPAEQSAAYDASARFVSRLSMLATQIMANPLRRGMMPNDVWSDGLKAMTASLYWPMALDWAHLCEYLPDVRGRAWDVIDVTLTDDTRPRFELRPPSAEEAWAEARDALLSTLANGRVVPPKLASRHKLERAWRQLLDQDTRPFLELVNRFSTHYLAGGLMDYPTVTNAGCLAATGLTADQFERLRARLCGYAEVFLQKAQRVRDQALISGWTDPAHEQWIALTTCTLDAPGMVGELARAVGADTDVLRRALEPLTMGGADGTTVNWGEDYFPPLMLIEDRYWFSPDVVLHTLTWRNLVWALNKINSDVFGETAANTMEPQLLVDAEAIFNQDPGLKVAMSATYACSDGRPGEVDALVYSEADNLVMQIQAKAHIASSSPRMTKGIEADVKIALRQLDDFSNAEKEERQRVLARAFGPKASDAKVVNAVLTRAGFGRHSSWESLNGTTTLTPSVLQGLVDQHRASHGRVRLERLATDALKLIDDLLMEAGIRTDAGDELDLGSAIVHVQFVRWDNAVVADAWQRLMPRIGKWSNASTRK